LAAVIGATGNQSPLAVVGDAFAGPASWLGLAVFVGVGGWFARAVTKA
jgi:hypothetical protein